MWDGLFMLLSLSAIMALASFLAGIVPLSFSLSQRQLRFITFLGTGVLVGTSLIVIIPEGIETMYSAAGRGHAHGSRGIEIVAASQKGVDLPFGLSAMERSEASIERGVKALADLVVKKTPEKHALASRADKSEDNARPTKEEEDKPQKGGDDDSTEGHKEGHDRIHADAGKNKASGIQDDERDPHAYVGISLIMGFILMYLVDVLPEVLSPSKPQYRPLHISLSDLSRGPHNSSTLTVNASPPPEPEPSAARPQSSATTIGLIIHACADGIALGASSTAPSTSLSLIIFLAIMLHKAPAAFGLTSVLLKQGFSKRTARTHLLFFSLAAPAGALVTWSIVHLLGRARLGGDDGLTWTTGCVLLFSGGTFLYVAMHSMNEATSGHGPEEPTANGYTDRRGKQGLSKGDIGTAVVGMLLPLLTQVGHVH